MIKVLILSQFATLLVGILALKLDDLTRKHDDNSYNLSGTCSSSNESKARTNKH